MIVKNRVKFSITRIQDFVEADGNKCLKCVCEMSSIKVSKRTGGKYKQKEVYFNTFIRGSEEDLQEIKNRMLEKTLEIQENLKLPQEERKKMNNRAIVHIFAYGFELINFYFAERKSSVCSVYIDDWDFSVKKIHKIEPKMLTIEEVEKLLEKERRKAEVKLEKELRQQKEKIADKYSSRAIF